MRVFVYVDVTLDENDVITFFSEDKDIKMKSASLVMTTPAYRDKVLSLSDPYTKHRKQFCTRISYVFVRNSHELRTNPWP